MTVYDPKSKKFTTIDTCFGTHHLNFAEDSNNTLWLSNNTGLGGAPVPEHETWIGDTDVKSRPTARSSRAVLSVGERAGGPRLAEELESLGHAFEREATRGRDPAAPSPVASGIAVTKIGLPASHQTLTKGALLSS